MLKTAGICMIIAGTFGGAIWNSKFQKDRLCVNEAMLDLIVYIKNRIQFFHEDLNEIYTSYENDILQKNGFLSELSEGDFNKALSDSTIMRSFDEKVNAGLLEFGKKLGKSGVEEQILNCDHCIDVLERGLINLRQDIPKKSKMYSSLCIIAGLAAALLLI